MWVNIAFIVFFIKKNSTDIFMDIDLETNKSILAPLIG
jgi:hypothetical protein